LTSADRIVKLTIESEKLDEKSIKKSKIFNDRFNSIIKTIEELAKNGVTRLTVTSFQSCKTDRMILETLRKRKFDVYVNYDEANSITITW